MSSNFSVDKWVLNGPISAPQLEAWKRDSGLDLPGDYLEFMQAHDGGEGLVGDNYLILWRLAEIAPFNREYEVPRYAPGLLVFGSNGGGEAFAYDMRQVSRTIVMVPFIGMSLDDARRIADDLSGLFTALKNDTLYD